MKQNKDYEKQKAAEYSEEYEEDIVEYEQFEHDVEVWTDYMSEELVTAYHVLKEFIDSQGLPILDACTFHDFVNFCYQFSSGRKPAC
ncbi:hypothetical protein ATCVNEJV2_301L [Acanthocystis turfacea Chlorella virus NE-JV-2]|uniref:Uncharacterized protein Z221L n=1 Tax=Chlorovirus heliozoae TaxID=322019 RepID=A7K8I1_9PHYC|nr:hypothetical protein ATCV1_Z221L [Acanthocystis turfacea chlorella virus 1]AGE49434.1 hypothetical protein ATCVCan0610SP_261L [Acanthocystis turfacea Chlorella virus Can0610SP]AGE55926.1 hypothetical protein ATCVMO0605SPH_277L [Acanthocystis turfacea Chlorella virus MO0605SPH]AGE56584.1 hypothetical protein ATCVNEJV2_301L [Acanthocystis turfacea Chlorella virus NE-JV-2]AGE56916.1 hypothetical protein ATCVNEJV3_264L [Acanthocystis turfacea Chlorella virus NE-JV-3]AGE59366.1 hypothetical prot